MHLTRRRWTTAGLWGTLRKNSNFSATTTTATATSTPIKVAMASSSVVHHVHPLLLDPHEVALGIACYRSPHVAGFSAVSKARFSDFVVHEIGMDGSMARLESVEPQVQGAALDHEDGSCSGEPTTTHDPAKNGNPAPAPAAAAGGTKRKLEETTVGSADPPREEAVNAPVDWDSLQTALEALAGLPKAEAVVKFLRNVENADTMVDASSVDPKNNTNDESPKFVVLDAIADKDVRRNLHQWIRQRLSFCAVADTVEGGSIRIWHRRYHRDMPHGDRQRNDTRRSGGTSNKPRGAPKDKPYLQFVLYKENMDTGAAMQQFCRKVSVGGRGRGGRGGRGGGRNRNNQQLRLGYAGNKDKRGITSQFVTIAARDCSVQHLCNVFNNNNNAGTNGGGHTSASGGMCLMRVGNFAYVREELRLGRLRGNRFDVVLRNVQFDGNNTSNKEDVLKMAAEAIRKNGFINHFGLQRFGKYHDTHLTGMSVLKGDYEGAIDIIMRPKEEERDDFREARVQWQKRFDFVDSAKDKATVEKECAISVLRTIKSYAHSEYAVLNSLAANPLDYQKAFSCIAKMTRMMFVHALQSFLWNHVASFRVERLGPEILKGDLVFADPNAESVEDSGKDDSQPDVKVVTAEDVAKGTYTLEDVVLPLIGPNTRDPENECGAMFDQLLKENGLTRSMICNLKDRSFFCNGHYRKLLCRPTDVDYDVLEYSSELQPLLQNDLMKLYGHQVERLTGPAKPDEKRLQAMVVGFSLPSSSYATMFMRELMKRPTSSEYQRELRLSGHGD